MKKEKILSLQVLKAIACIEIIVCHSGIWDIIGKEGTSIFLVLSGFLFAYNYYDRKIQLSIKRSVSFSLSRIKRLYPLHICSILVLLPLNALHAKTLITNIKELLIQVLLSQALFRDEDILFGHNGAS